MAMAMAIDTGLVVGIISALVALAGAGVSIWGQFRLARLSVELEERRARREKLDEAAAVLSRFREPLLNAAFELQSRLFNILRQDMLRKYYAGGSEREREYAVENTLFVVGQYLGWTEVLRREMQFLDLGEVADTRRLSELQDSICNLFLASDIGAALRIFRGDQRAMGEVMLVKLDDSTAATQCMGYAAFVGNRSPEFRRWFDPLAKDLERLASDISAGEKRLVSLQHALVDLIDFLDPECVRFPRPRRGKV